MSSGNWRPFCLGLIVLKKNTDITYVIPVSYHIEIYVAVMHSPNLVLIQQWTQHTNHFGSQPRATRSQAPAISHIEVSSVMGQAP